MKHLNIAAVVIGLSVACAGSASAATFAGYEAGTTVFFDDDVEFDFNPAEFSTGLGIFDFNFDMGVELVPDLSSGGLFLYDPINDVDVLEGSVLDFMLSINDTGDDTLSMLFENFTGAAAFVIATYTGDLDSEGASSFFDVGVSLGNGSLTIVNATLDQPQVIPLPAGMVLLLTCIGGLAVIRRRAS